MRGVGREGRGGEGVRGGREKGRIGEGSGWELGERVIGREAEGRKGWQWME